MRHNNGWRRQVLVWPVRMFAAVTLNEISRQSRLRLRVPLVLLRALIHVTGFCQY